MERCHPRWLLARTIPERDKPHSRRVRVRFSRARGCVLLLNMPVSLIAKAIQSKLSASGLDWVKLESFTLSSREKTISLELRLEGEDKPVKADIHYSLGTGNTVEIREVETSRPWMTEALKLVLVKTGNRFALPGGLKGKMLKVLL